MFWTQAALLLALIPALAVAVCSAGCATCTGVGLAVPTVCQACDESLGWRLSFNGTLCVSSCEPFQLLNSTASPHRCVGALRPITGGHCEPFADTSLAPCHDLIGIGTSIYIPPGSSQATRTSQYQAAVLGLSSLVDETDCKKLGPIITCLEAYPLCVNDTVPELQLPQLPCQSTCEKLHQVCAIIPAVASLLDLVMACSDSYGSAINDASFTNVDPAQPRFPNSTVYYSNGAMAPCASLKSGDVAALPCPYLSAHSNSSNPFSTCAPICNFPVFSWRTDNSQEATIDKLVQVCSALSLVFSLATIVTWVSSYDKRQYPSNLIIWLSVCCVGVALGFLLSSFTSSDQIHCATMTEPHSGRSSGLCMLQGILLVFFLLATFTWWFMIAMNVFLRVTMDKNDDYSAYFHIFAWGLPAVLTIAAMGNDSIVYSKAFRVCFLSEGTAQWSMLFAWLLMLALLGTILLAIVLRKIFVVKTNLNDSHAGRLNLRTLAFLVTFDLILAFTLAWNIHAGGVDSKIVSAQRAFTQCLSSIVDTTGQGVDFSQCKISSKTNFGLAVVAYFLQCLQGFWVAWIFVLNRGVLKQWARRFGLEVRGSSSSHMRPSQSLKNMGSGTSGGTPSGAGA